LLKRRYRKRKLAYKREKPSGTGRTKAFVKAEKALAEYSFLQWLDPFVQGAESVSNMDEPNKRKYKIFITSERQK
jgi:hypothetical protein